MSTTRKRSHSLESEATSLKKHIIADENGEPHPNVNGVTAQQDDLEVSGQDKLELFRKEAIYRRMKHYSRECQYSQARIAELEERKVTCEAGLAAMSACWQQLVDTLRSQVGSDEESPTVDEIRDLYNISTYVSDESMPELKSSLERAQQATTQVVSKLLSKSGGAASRDQRDAECRKAQAESAALRSQMDMLRTSLQDSQELSARYKEALSSAENRLERLKSKTVQSVQPKPQANTEDQEVVTENEQRKPSSPAPNGDHSHSEHAHLEEGYWQEIAEGREKQILELQREVHDLKGKVHMVEVQLQAPTLPQIMNSAHYKIAVTRLAQTNHTLSERDVEIAKLKEELQQATQSNRSAEDALKRETNQEILDLKNILAQRDTNLARIRENRDQQSAELHERKVKESARISSCEENKALAASRAERITVLNSQLTRCRLQLAAQSNSEDIVSLLLNDPNDDVTVVEKLRTRLSAAENRLAALEQACSKLDEEHPDITRHIQAESDALQKFSDVSKELEKYRRVYGELSSLQPDVGQLASQLKQKDDELQRLRLLDQQREQASISLLTETSLYMEIEKLSAAWESLDNQVKSKVFDLTSMEEKLSKALTEKAKAENKYYAAMRDKEAIDLERKNLTRNLEKHAKLVDALKDSESKLTQQINIAQKILATRETAYSTHEKELRDLRSKLKEGEYKLQEEERKSAASLKSAQLAEERSLSTQRELRSSIEEHVRSKKDLQRQALKLQSKERLVVSRGRTTDQEVDSRVADSIVRPQSSVAVLVLISLAETIEVFYLQHQFP
ncbi:E3 ubiquitin-protein ligase bre1 [Marasmius tenuissimus]|uniref:E3 ubiquitin protein ligase n=1 Tax=Marasmius tenuissimus TaxID=585030 RepID=A0ABR3A747_9AGAR